MGPTARCARCVHSLRQPGAVHASTMTSPGRSLPLELTIADSVDATSASLHRHFRQTPGVDLKKARLVEIARAANADNQFDVLILPLPNCHGVSPASGLIQEICTYVPHALRNIGISEATKPCTRQANCSIFSHRSSPCRYYILTPNSLLRFLFN